MTIRVKLPDGSAVNFPDGTPDDVMSSAIQAHLNVPAANTPPHSLLGVAKTGAVQGVVDTVALPDTVARIFTTGTDKLRALAGQPTSTQATEALKASPSVPAGSGRYGQIPQALRDVANQPETPSWQQQLEDLAFKHVQRDDAQTNAEKFIQMAARAGTGAAMTGGLGAGSVRAAIPAVLTGAAAGSIGGAASEGAGQLTAGTKAEPYARFLAGLVLGGGATAALNKVSTAESLLNRSLAGYTDHDFQAARDLMQQSAAHGVQLTSAEALSQVRGGNTGLMSLQRYAENMPASAPTMSNFMQQRPAQNAAAVEDALNAVGPRSAAPTEIGPAIQRAAQGHLNDVRQDINAQARPYYQQAQGQSDQLTGLGVNAFATQAPREWTALNQNPAFNVALRQVREDPLNVNIAHLPDHDLTVLDRVKKRMDFNAGSATNAGVGRQPDTVTAAAYTEGNRQLKRMIDNQFPDYGAARAIGAQGRENVLNPAGRAPIGQLSETADTLKQQAILSPKLASDASPQQVGDAVHTLVQQGAHAEAQQLVRMKLQDVFDTALPNVKGNAEQFRGANFANALTRHQNQIQSLQAAVHALPGGAQIWPQLHRVIQGLTAQGQRMPVGSPTEFNRLLSSAASQGGGILSLPLRGVQGATNAFKDAYRQAIMGSTADELAQRLIRQDGGAGLLNMTQRPARNVAQQAAHGLLSFSRLTP